MLKARPAQISANSRARKSGKTTANSASSVPLCRVREVLTGARSAAAFAELVTKKDLTVCCEFLPVLMPRSTLRTPQRCYYGSNHAVDNEADGSAKVG